jgi:hypothetical protein
MKDSYPLAMPPELQAIAPPPCLLPGESRQEFERIHRMLIDDIRPETTVEWLWTLDLVDLSWEILRYRSLKQKTLETFRAVAVEMVLRRVDGCGFHQDGTVAVQAYCRCNASQWRDDPEAAAEIEARLERYGFDAIALNTAVYNEARDQFEMFDTRAQQRRMVLLREIGVRREFAKRVEKVSERLAGGEFRCLEKRNR